MLMSNQHLYKSPAIEIYGHCRLLLPWLRLPCWFFLQSGEEKLLAWESGDWTHNLRSLFSVRCLLTSSKDYYYRIPKDVLNMMLNRATPMQWILCTNAKMAISLLNLTSGPPLSSKLRSRAYIDDRKPGIGVINNASKLKIGKQSIVNRLNCLRKITFDCGQEVFASMP